MHQCRDALLWCIITVMHYRNNASTLWCIKHICQCDLLYIMFYWYDVLRCSVMNGWCMVWCVGMQCDEWVMHSMMQCVMNGWCMSGVMWMNEWMNEWTNEWMVNKWACGWCRMTVCVLLYFICICNMSLFIFRAIFMWRINPYTPQDKCLWFHTEPDL